jgi:hypothetical protein
VTAGGAVFALVFVGALRGLFPAPLDALLAPLPAGDRLRRWLRFGPGL